MTIPACACCSRIDTEDSIVVNGTYSYGDTMLASWVCPCGTNRAINFKQVSPELRRAAMLADLALNGKDNEMEG